MRPLTRHAARRAGSPRYYTGKPCRRRHVAERDTRTGHCLECEQGPFQIKLVMLRREDAEAVHLFAHQLNTQAMREGVDP